MNNVKKCDMGEHKFRLDWDKMNYENNSVPLTKCIICGFDIYNSTEDKK